MGVCVLEFIPCMDKLFDESILIGSGYTARETLRYEIKPTKSADEMRGRGDFWHFMLQAFQQALAVGPSLSLNLELQEFLKCLQLLFVL